MLRCSIALVLLFCAVVPLAAQRELQPRPELPQPPQPNEELPQPDEEPWRKRRPLPKPALFQLGPYESTESKDELLSLKMQKYNAAIREFDAARQFFQIGRGDSGLLCDAAERVLAAVIDLYPQPRDQVQWHHKNVELLRYVESLAKYRVEDGSGTTLDAARAEYRRLGAEIALVRLERKLGIKTAGQSSKTNSVAYP